jgi:hypothetical protein
MSRIEGVGKMTFRDGHFYEGLFKGILKWDSSKHSPKHYFRCLLHFFSSSGKKVPSLYR